MMVDNRKKVVFLGTPQVAQKALEVLLEKASHLIQVILVVSQPPAPSGRNMNLNQSPVHEYALSKGIPVLTPKTARDAGFLDDLSQLKPDLCITAAYGNYLPQQFLNIPKFGTLNIHPSLLPLYRGAAPVQRCLENGDKETGVTLLFSTAKMDCGPILAQKIYPLDSAVKAPELLEILFKEGADLLVKNLAALFLNRNTPREQDESLATFALKIKPEDALLDLQLPAHVLHNKVRAFAGWPGTKAILYADNAPVEIKVITTSVTDNNRGLNFGEIAFGSGTLDLCCSDNMILQILELQRPGKKVINATDFKNQMSGKKLRATN